MCKTVGHTAADENQRCSRCKKSLREKWEINWNGYELVGFNVYNSSGVIKIKIDP
jgi:hypothetical protein